MIHKSTAESTSVGGDVLADADYADTHAELVETQVVRQPSGSTELSLPIGVLESGRSQWFPIDYWRTYQVHNCILKR
jgi:hypothetical protein